MLQGCFLWVPITLFSPYNFSFSDIFSLLLFHVISQNLSSLSFSRLSFLTKTTSPTHFIANNPHLSPNSHINVLVWTWDDQNSKSCQIRGFLNPQIFSPYKIWFNCPMLFHMMRISDWVSRTPERFIKWTMIILKPQILRPICCNLKLSKNWGDPSICENM